MRILYIIDSLSTGGKERQLVELIKGLIKGKSIDIQLVILSNEIIFNDINKLNINIHLLPRKYKKDLSIYKKLLKICRDFRPDIIHSWELMCSVYSIPLSKLIGAKFINGIIRYSPSNFGFLRSKLFFTTKLTFLCSDIILSNSYAGLRAYKVKNLKSYCIYNGFDLDRIKNIEDIENTRKKYNIVTKYVVGMVARFQERKDYYSYIYSAINILHKRNDVTFLTVGDGNTLNKCMALVPTRYVEYIRFLGKQKDVESIINVFNIGVLASSEEGISNSIMEYMALEKPVVATRHGGNEEIVIDNKTGFLITQNNIDELTEKIEYLLDNKEIAIAMGRAGRKRLENDFNLKKMTDAHIELYNNCLLRKR